MNRFSTTNDKGAIVLALMVTYWPIESVKDILFKINKLVELGVFNHFYMTR